MELSIRTVGVELSPTLHALVERRITFALARFGGSIGRATCSITDLPGPRGVDKQVRLKVKPINGRFIVVEQTEATVHRAIDFAVDRIERGIARELQRLGEKPQRRGARSQTSSRSRRARGSAS